MGVRKHQATLTPAERAAFVAAVKALKANGSYDTFVAQHRAAFLAGANDPAHGGPGFLPWHREYLRRFERALQAIDPGVSIPYWDWTVDRSIAALPWTTDFMGGNGSGPNQQVTTSPFAFATGEWTLNVRDPGDNRRFLQRAFGAMGGLPTTEEVERANRVVPYDSAPWNRNSSFNTSFRNRNERVIHNPGHMWVGGSMMAMSSPNDPVFWLHHCNIDRLWARWQRAHPEQGYLPPSGTPGVVAGHALDDPMPPWAGEAEPPTPRSVLNHFALGYLYDDDPGRIMIADFSGGQVPAQVRSWESWGQDPLFNGWQDDNDLQLVGDFLHLGYDQLLSVNRTDAGDGRIMIADFSGGQVPAQVRYWEAWGQDPLFNGWQDDNDWQFVGDFMRLGHDQLLSVNRTDAGDGRIMIADFSGGQVPAQVRYWENWGQHNLFDGWQDDNDWQFVGDFMHLGYDQLLSINRTDAGDGRIMIADFSGGEVPAQVRYWENWGQHELFDGWQDDNDWQFVGDFMRLGYDQLLSVNRTDAGDGRIMIADFSAGQVPAQVRYWENWGQHELFNGWQDDNDWQFVGDFMRLGYDQLLSVNRL
jgi:tyrosinase-like protein